MTYNGPESGGGQGRLHAAAGSATPRQTRHGDPVLAAGERLDGYEITRVLGIGGMAVVYAAVQLSLKRQVALKVPLPRWATNSSFMQRFERESEALAALNHPNIVNVIDRGQSGALPYFVMEYVDGVSLERAITAGRLSYGDYLTIIRQVRDALAYIHSNGIVHLDLKPANILLGRNGRVKVGDFGIAAMAWDSVVGSGGGGNTMLGTPRFMAPEQHQRAAILDARTDIYALAVTYHLMLCGGFPETGQSRASAAASGMPRAVEPVLSKALAPVPGHRYATVEQFSNDLLEALVGTTAFLQLDSFAGPTSFGMDEPGEASPVGAPSQGDPPQDLEPVFAATDSTGGRTAEMAEEERIEAALAGAGAAARSGRRAALWTVGFPAAIAVTAAAGAFWWPASPGPASGGGSARPAHAVRPDRAHAARPWVLAGTLPVPRYSYSFMALSPHGDLALATFNNRSLGNLPEDLPVILVRNVLGGVPQVVKVCENPFASQRGYSGLAFGEDGALFVSADTGLAETSYLARYTPGGSPDMAFGVGGRVMAGLRCHGIDVAAGKLYLALESGEVLVLDPATGTRLGLIPKAVGKGIVRDLAVDGESGRVFGVRTGGMILWEPEAGAPGDFASYVFRELAPPDMKAPRALEGICFSRSAGRALLVPDKTAEMLECDGRNDPTRLPIGNAPAGAVFVDGAVSPDGETLFVSNVARSQVHVLRRQAAAPGR